MAAHTAVGAALGVKLMEESEHPAVQRGCLSFSVEGRSAFSNGPGVRFAMAPFVHGEELSCSGFALGG